MYNPQLKAFVCAADCGSFTQAAERLYLSPTAVMKQVNALEAHLQMQLISRTNQGIQLTPAGESIYADAKFLFDYSARAVRRARQRMSDYEKTFCVGTSILNPCQPFVDLWGKLASRFPGYRLNIVPFEDEHTTILQEISALGEKFDFLVGVCDSANWLLHGHFLQLGTYRKCVSVRMGHPLAAKERLSISDLYGQNLMMVPRGDSLVNDQFRHDLEVCHPQIHIVDAPQYYDMSVFNHCAQTDDVLLNIECWREVHPLLVTIPVDWDYVIPYGILYAVHPPEDVTKLIAQAKQLVKSR